MTTGKPVTCSHALSTFAKLSNYRVSTDRIIDGKDIFEILLGKKEAKSPHHVLFYEDEGIRRGDWKLVKKKVKGKTRLELYDLYEDLGEKKNMSNAHPEMVEERVLLDFNMKTPPPAGWAVEGYAFGTHNPTPGERQKQALGTRN